MRASGFMTLAGCIVGFGCAKTQSVDPTPVFASQADLALIRQAISPCLRKFWVPSAKGRPARVTLRWQLDEDGRLLSDPEIVESSPPDSPAAQMAIKAVRSCEPFRLPLDRYHLWKQIVFNFDSVT